MTLSSFEVMVASAENVDENDRVWFPKWLRRYALMFRRGLTDELTVNLDSTLRFSRMLLASGAPA